MQHYFFLAYFIINNAIIDRTIIPMTTIQLRPISDNSESGNGPPAKSNCTDISKISDFLRKKQILDVLQNQDISIIIRANHADEYFKETESIKPNITMGGLYGDWCKDI